MKLFVSIELPDSVKEELVSIQQKVEKRGMLSGSFVTREKLHCTLFFIGTTTEEQAFEIKQRLSSLIFPSFNLSLGALAFNSVSHPHILWTGLNSDSNKTSSGKNHSVVNNRKLWISQP